MSARQAALEEVAREVRIYNRRSGLDAYAPREASTIGELIDARLPDLDVDAAGWSWRHFVADVNKINAARR